MSSSAQFWSRFAARYDGHIISRDADFLASRTAAAVGKVARVLDAGCGTGQVTVELARMAAQVDATDFVDEMLAVARNKAAGLALANVSFHKMSADSLTFADATFDAVVLSNVLHLVDAPDKVLSEAKRVLLPGGKLVAPTYCQGEGVKAILLSRLTSALFRVPVRHRFRVDELVAMVKSAGFTITLREVVRLKVPLVFVEAVVA